MKIKRVLLVAIILCFFTTPAIANASQRTLINISAESAYVCDYESGAVVFAKNENERKPISPC